MFLSQRRLECEKSFLIETSDTVHLRWTAQLAIKTKGLQYDFMKYLKRSLCHSCSHFHQFWFLISYDSLSLLSPAFPLLSSPFSPSPETFGFPSHIIWLQTQSRWGNAFRHRHRTHTFIYSCMPGAACIVYMDISHISHLHNHAKAPLCLSIAQIRWEVLPLY